MSKKIETVGDMIEIMEVLTNTQEKVIEIIFDQTCAPISIHTS